MKFQEMVAVAVGSAVIFSAGEALAGIPGGTVPEPGSVVVWGVALGIGGVLWLWQRKRAS